MSQQNRLPTEQEFQDWLEHPATQALRSLLLQEIQTLKDQWAAGAFTNEAQYATHMLNASAIGGIRVAERVIAMDYDQILGAFDE